MTKACKRAQRDFDDLSPCMAFALGKLDRELPIHQTYLTRHMNVGSSSLLALVTRGLARKVWLYAKGTAIAQPFVLRTRRGELAWKRGQQ